MNLMPPNVSRGRIFSGAKLRNIPLECVKGYSRNDRGEEEVKVPRTRKEGFRNKLLPEKWKWMRK